MTTPKNLADLENLDYVETVPSEQSAEDFAKNWFEGAFGHTGEIFTRDLFTEDGKAVQEHYFDSGSEDYLYTIKTF